MRDQLYLKTGTGEQTKILRQIKEQSNLTWSEISQILQVKKRMVYFYLKEKSHLPLYRLVNLCKKTNFCLDNIENLETVAMKNYEQKPIRTPLLDKYFSEFLGALSGDGNIDPNNYRISIGCNSIVDYDYVTKKVKKMFFKLFDIETTIKIERGVVYCQVYSKELANYLEKFEITKGNRKNKIFIPKRILKDKKLLIAFLRGVFDTDGSFHRKRVNSSVVEYISCSPAFLLQIKNALNSLGLRATLSGKSVYIYDQKTVESFFKVVKPTNPKHCIKYAIFKETGKVPLHKEIKAFVM